MYILLFFLSSFLLSLVVSMLCSLSQNFNLAVTSNSIPSTSSTVNLSW